MNWVTAIAGAAIGGLAIAGGLAWYLGDVARDIDRYLHGSGKER